MRDFLLSSGTKKTTEIAEDTENDYNSVTSVHWYEKKIATNTTNSIRTHATGVRFSSYQFVVFFMFIYVPKVHSRLCG